VNTIQLTIRGSIGGPLVSAFDGMRFEQAGPGAMTVTGRVADQSQLYGLIDNLRDLGIELVSLRCAPDDPPVPQLDLIDNHRH